MLIAFAHHLGCSRGSIKNVTNLFLDQTSFFLYHYQLAHAPREVLNTLRRQRPGHTYFVKLKPEILGLIGFDTQLKKRPPHIKVRFTRRNNAKRRTVIAQDLLIQRIALAESRNSREFVFV